MLPSEEEEEEAADHTSTPTMKEKMKEHRVKMLNSVDFVKPTMNENV